MLEGESMAGAGLRLTVCVESQVQSAPQLTPRASRGLSGTVMANFYLLERSRFAVEFAALDCRRHKRCLLSVLRQSSATLFHDFFNVDRFLCPNRGVHMMPTMASLR